MKKRIWYYAFFSLPKGPLNHYILAWNEKGLCRFQLPGIYKKDTEVALRKNLPSNVILKKASPQETWIGETTQKIHSYFVKKQGLLFKEFPLNFQEINLFQKKVYREVSKIPFGKVLAYSDIAHKIHCPRGARQVGRALSLNPFSYSYSLPSSYP